MAGQQRIYTDKEIAHLEAAEKAKKNGLSDLEMMRLERAATPAQKPAVDKIKVAPSPTKTRIPYGINYGLIDQGEPSKATPKDILQAARQTVGQFAAFPAATAVSAGLMAPRVGGFTFPPEIAEAAGQKVGKAITGTPQTPEAQEVAKGMNAIPTTLFGPFSKAIEAMPNAESRIALSVAMLMFPYAKGLAKGFLGSKIKNGIPPTPKEIDVILKQTELPKDVAAKVEAIRVGAKLPPEYTGNPSEFGVKDYLEQGTGEEPRMWHVTTAKGKVLKEGLKSRAETKTEGLGGGYNNQAPNKVSVTFSESQAIAIKERLKLAAEAARNKKTPSQVFDEFTRDAGLADDSPYDLAKELRAPESVWDDWGLFDEWLNKEYQGSSYRLLQDLDDAIPNIMPDAEGYGLRVGLTGSEESMAKIDPEQIDYFEVGAKKGAKAQHIPDEAELRFDPADTFVVSPETTVPPAPPSPVSPKPPGQILTEALKQSEIIHPERQAAWTQEYGERFAKAEEQIQAIGGSAGLKAGRSQMAGKMPQISFEPPAITPEIQEALKVEIAGNKLLTTGERFQAEAGLDRLLGGDFPAPKQTELLNRVFGGELIDVLTQKKGTMAKVKYWAGQIANVPRSIMASFDLSAPLRQGIWLVGHPKEFFGDFKDMIQSFGSRAGYQAVVNNITSRPTFDLMKRSGLALTEMGSTLRKTEEQFLGANVLERGGAWAEKKLGLAGKAINLPVKGIEASQRAYTGFLNKLRADMFDKLVKDATDLGLYNKKGGGYSPYANKKLSDDIAWYVNAATGRGKLGKSAESGANILNAIFFSPRLMSSRLTLLNPKTYLSPGISPFVRRAALKDAIKFGSIYSTIAAASMLMGKAVGDKDTLGADPRSADFGKIRIGNTRIDLGGGFGQYIRQLALVAPALAGKIPRAVGGKGFDWYTVNSTTGKKKKIGGGFDETSIKDLLYNFFESKENPILSFATTIAGERSFGGGKINLGKELANRITPIIAQDIMDMAKDDPEILKIVPIAIASIFGAGVQTYGKKKQ